MKSNHFVNSKLGRSLNIGSTSFQRTDPAGPSAACPVAMVRIGAAGLRAGNDLALISASPMRARAREVMTYRTAYALQFQPSASSAIIGIDVGRQQHIARAANPVHKIMSSARTRTHLPVAPSPFRVVGIAFEHHPIGAQMERRDGPRRIDTQRLSPIARNQADRNPLAVAVQIGRNIPPRGFGQNLQPAEPLVQTIKRQFRQIFDRPLARPVGYECSDKKAFFIASSRFLNNQFTDDHIYLRTNARIRYIFRSGNILLRSYGIAYALPVRQQRHLRRRKIRIRSRFPEFVPQRRNHLLVQTRDRMRFRGAARFMALVIRHPKIDMTQIGSIRLKKHTRLGPVELSRSARPCKIVAAVVFRTTAAP